MKNTGISNSDDVIDSRDVIARIEEIESMIESPVCETCGCTLTWNAGEYVYEGHTDECESDVDPDAGPDEDELEELKYLKALQDEAEGYSNGDWKYGSTLIRDSYFVDYCKELVQDIGDMPKNIPAYIKNNIDWDGVADDLKVDYTEVDFDGVAYYIR
jgi:hypothetical protein